MQQELESIKEDRTISGFGSTSRVASNVCMRPSDDSLKLISCIFTEIKSFLKNGALSSVVETSARLQQHQPEPDSKAASVWGEVGDNSGDMCPEKERYMMDLRLQVTVYEASELGLAGNGLAKGFPAGGAMRVWWRRNRSCLT